VFIQARQGPELRAVAVATTWYDYRVVNVYPHDRGAFTQGLVFRDGFLFESTGLNGRSTLRQVRLETGEVIRQHSVESQHFAEGLTDWGNRLVQLTWQSHVGFVYDMTTFAPQRTFSIQGEGWGLTHDQHRLIMSDGTASLRFLDPETWQETGHLTVTEGDQPVARLNELEVVKGEIFANVWQTDHLAIIDPQSGLVTARVDLRGLLSPADRMEPVDVLNGIAYDAKRDRLFVTGKLWPRLFEIRLQPRL
jgi:glutaminyl-peptide cyclotransferase